MSLSLYLKNTSLSVIRDLTGWEQGPPRFLNACGVTVERTVVHSTTDVAPGGDTQNLALLPGNHAVWEKSMKTSRLVYGTTSF